MILSNINNLGMYSTKKVKVKCDICGIESEIRYRSYIKNIKNGGYYACSQKCASDKNKQTYLRKTGFKHQMHNPEVIKKYEKTNLKIYGVKHPKQNEGIKNKSRETCLKNYGVEYGFLLFEKCKESLNKIYGVDNAMKSKEVRDKVSATNIIKYGYKTALMNPEIKKESNKKMIELYGTIHPLQNVEIMKKMINSSYKFKVHENGLVYQGKYEKDFIDMCVKNNIPIERGLTINYELNNENKIYFSDFYLRSKNLIIEIKSTWIWNKHKEKNIKKMETVIEQGYSYILIIDKKYNEFLKLLGKV